MHAMRHNLSRSVSLARSYGRPPRSTETRWPTERENLSSLLPTDAAAGEWMTKPSLLPSSLNPNSEPLGLRRTRLATTATVDCVLPRRSQPPLPQMNSEERGERPAFYARAVCTAFLSKRRAKLRDWAVWPAKASHYSQAASIVLK